MIGFVLSTEAAAAFDDLTRSEGIEDPSLSTWPNTFRTHRFVPAVEYIRAQRARTLLIREMDKLMSQYDVFLSPTGSASLGMTNLTGHPAVALRAGFIDNSPVELMVTGRLYDEATMLRVALALRARHEVAPEGSRVNRVGAQALFTCVASFFTSAASALPCSKSPSLSAASM